MTRTKPIYRRRFQSTLQEMAATIREALRVLADHCWIATDDQFELHLCLEEALVNAIQHGNQNKTDLSVVLEIEERGDTCFIRVYDEGHGFTPEEVRHPDPTTPGGRGICLIKAFMDHVKYVREDQCFEMSFRRQIGCRGEKTHG